MSDYFEFEGTVTDVGNNVVALVYGATNEN